MALIGLVAVVAATTSGCSSRRSGGYYDDEAAAGAEVDEAALAGQPSINQFEELGRVLPGGEFQDISFAFDSDRLDSAAMEAVRYNAAILAGDAGRNIEIEGHCDDRGSSEYNLALGARRARSVKDALAAEGISSNRMSTVSYGEELPICKSMGEQCWAKNRRAHLVDLTR